MTKLHGQSVLTSRMVEELLETEAEQAERMKCEAREEAVRRARAAYDCAEKLCQETPTEAAREASSIAMRVWLAVLAKAP